MALGVVAARLIGSDDVDSVEIRVDRVVVLEVVVEEVGVEVVEVLEVRVLTAERGAQEPQ